MYGEPNLSRRLTLRERLTGHTADFSRLKAKDITARRPVADFIRGIATPFMFGYQPALREPEEEYRLAYYEVGRRAIDSIHNSGWLSGGIEQAMTMIVGEGLALNAKPAPILFGNDVAGAATWARDVERRFTVWSGNPYACDITGRNSLGQMMAEAMRTWFAYGEILGIVRYKLHAGNTHGTKVQLLSPSRCPHNSATNSDAVDGIVMDSDGCAIRYCITNPKQPRGFMSFARPDEIEVKARDETGRVIVLHMHASPPGVARGLTRLAPALQVVRQCDQLANATLTNALVQAIFAAVMETDVPNTDRLLDALRTPEEAGIEAEVDPSSAPTLLDGLMLSKSEWYSKGTIDLGVHGKIFHAFPGEKLHMMRSESPNDNYKPFMRFLLLEIARCLGITYEQLTGDREGATYSSERMGGAENWLLMMRRRKHIAAPFMQGVYENWLEEDIELGNTVFPGGPAAFVANRDLACSADWRGPPKPQADDLKAAKANEVKLLNKIISRQMWCNEEGADEEEVFEQLKREQDFADEIGLDLTPPPKGGGLMEQEQEQGQGQGTSGADEV